jgi:hypothetical protein
MDSGRLESVSQVKTITSLIFKLPDKAFSQPYVFHQAMQSMFIPLQLATNARGLELVTDLDKNIDDVRHAAVMRYNAYTLNRLLGALNLELEDFQKMRSNDDLLTSPAACLLGGQLQVMKHG